MISAKGIGARREGEAPIFCGAQPVTDIDA
jgi:hypothetical protein